LRNPDGPVINLLSFKKLILLLKTVSHLFPQYLILVNILILLNLIFGKS